MTLSTKLCNGVLHFDEMAARFNCSVDEFMRITKFEVSKITSLNNDKLVEINGNTLRVTPEGMLIVRNVAVAFDPGFVPVTNKYSTTI